MFFSVSRVFHLFIFCETECYIPSNIFSKEKTQSSFFTYVHAIIFICQNISCSLLLVSHNKIKLIRLSIDTTSRHLERLLCFENQTYHGHRVIFRVERCGSNRCRFLGREVRLQTGADGYEKVEKWHFSTEGIF